MNSQRILSPIAAGLNCKWNQLQEALDLVDDQPLLWWWSKRCSRVSIKTFRRSLKEGMDVIDGYLRDENLCNIVKDGELFTSSFNCQLLTSPQFTG